MAADDVAVAEGTAPPPGAFGGRRGGSFVSRDVLLIEEDRPLRAAMADALASYGYHVDTARDGGEGIAKICEHDFDVVVADLHAADDGERVLRRSLEGAPSVPVICIAEDRQASRRDAALGAGAAAYLIKPVTAADLHTAIEGVLFQR